MNAVGANERHLREGRQQRGKQQRKSPKTTSQQASSQWRCGSAVRAAASPRALGQWFGNTRRPNFFASITWRPDQDLPKSFGPHTTRHAYDNIQRKEEKALGRKDPDNLMEAGELQKQQRQQLLASRDARN